MQGKEYSLYHDGELEAMREYVADSIKNEDGLIAIAKAIVFVGDVLCKGFDLLAQSRK